MVAGRMYRQHYRSPPYYMCDTTKEDKKRMQRARALGPLQRKRALGPLPDFRAPVILTGFPHRYWSCHLRAWPQNLDPRWQDNLKCLGIFSRNLFPWAVRNETKCRNQTLQPISWCVLSVWSVIQMPMISGMPDRLKMGGFHIPIRRNVVNSLIDLINLQKTGYPLHFLYINSF